MHPLPFTCSLLLLGGGAMHPPTFACLLLLLLLERGMYTCPPAIMHSAASAGEWCKTPLALT